MRMRDTNTNGNIVPSKRERDTRRYVKSKRCLNYRNDGTNGTLPAIMTLLSEDNGTRQVPSFFVFVFIFIFKLKSTTCLSRTTDTLPPHARSVQRGRRRSLSPKPAIIVSGLAGAAVANLHAAWTHKVVSMPSEATFWQRVPSKSSWKALAPAAAISAAMPYISLYLTAGVAILLGLHKVNPENLDQYTSRQWACLAVRGLATIVFAIFTSLFLCIPATVTQVRIEASLLPEEQDSIVPFDRTFGGKVVGQLLGGTGRIGFLDAWRSFNWEARRRLIELYVKIGAIMAFAIFVVVHVLAFEVFGVMGPALGDYLAKALHEAQKGQ